MAVAAVTARGGRETRLNRAQEIFDVFIDVQRRLAQQHAGCCAAEK